MNHHQLPGVAQGSGEQWRRRPPPRDEQGGRGRDRGWTVFEIPSTLASLRAVGSKTCGPDRALTAVDDSVVLISAAASDADAPGPRMRCRISGAGDEARA